VVARARLAVIGFGPLGRACVEAVNLDGAVELAGVVRRPDAAARLPAPWQDVAVVTHLRELRAVAAALLCVPPAVATGIAREVLQLGVPLVECTRLEAPARDKHCKAIHDAAHRHRVPAIVGAGWDPGLLPLLRRAFAMLVPSGQTTETDRPGVSLHHSEAAQNIPGIRAALSTEQRDVQGRLTRYVYAELAEGAVAAHVAAALAADPLFAGEQTLLFPVERIAAVEEAGHGVLLERRGTARSGAHQNILLEARFDLHGFAARVMLDASRRLGALAPGAHRYSLWSDPA
jgi:diaminopimelate dehydrogenase